MELSLGGVGMSLEQHLVEKQRGVPGATGALTGVFQRIGLAAKIINSRVNRAGLAGVLGLTGETNVQGEAVQKLDHFANETLIHTVQGSGHVCIMGSEENSGVIEVTAPLRDSKYVLLFDPLDGSGNIDVNASIGTIFSIFERKTPGKGPGTMEDCLRPGRELVASGYVIYGSSTMFVYSVGDGVHGFTLDPQVGEFFLSHPVIEVPVRGDTYSVNEGNCHGWHASVQAWAEWVKRPSEGRRAYRSRYIGAMVADLHRTLLRGGIFAYPADSAKPKGKLRLLYEAAPFAFLVVSAGGSATDGHRNILDIVPEALHQRTPLFIGSRDDVADLCGFLNNRQ